MLRLRRRGGSGSGPWQRHADVRPIGVASVPSPPRSAGRNAEVAHHSFSGTATNPLGAASYHHGCGGFLPRRRGMHVSSRVGFALLAFCVAGVAFGAATTPRTVRPFDSQWRQFRFDQYHTGYNRFEHSLTVANVPSLELSWQAQLGRVVFSSSPAVVDGVVYIASTDGTLWAFAADGCGSDFCDTPLWKSTQLAQIVDSPSV